MIQFNIRNAKALFVMIDFLIAHYQDFGFSNEEMSTKVSYMILDFKRNHGINKTEFMQFFTLPERTKLLSSFSIVGILGDIEVNTILLKCDLKEIDHILTHAPSFYIFVMTMWSPRELNTPITTTQRNMLIKALEAYEQREDIKKLIYQRLSKIPNKKD